MRTLDPPRFYCGRQRLSYYCHVTLIGLRFRQVHSSFATFVVAPTQRGHTGQTLYLLFYGRGKGKGLESLATTTCSRGI